MSTINPAHSDLVQVFRDTFRRVTSTVCVITTQTDEGVIGMTATSVTSLSGEPPSLLCCVNRTNRSYEQIRSSQTFGVNFLRADQATLAQRYARPGADKIIPSEELDLSLEWSVPPLVTSVASASCHVENVFNQYTHGIFIGKITDIKVTESPSTPLLYMDAAFREVALDDDLQLRKWWTSPEAW